MAQELKKMGIKDWAEEDRPREKLIIHGRRALSDAELIAILIGSGNTTETAVELSRRILLHFNNNVNDLGKATVQDLSKFKGIGDAKAISIVAALELGRRRTDTDYTALPQVQFSKDIFDYLRPIFSDLQHEEFWIILLNRANKIIKKVMISKGGTAIASVDAKIIFKLALDHQASSIALAHNHPSGNPKPSPQDIQLTKKLLEAGRVLDITLLDHLIFYENNYTSLKDEGVF